jgi:hypothetical protein
VTFEPADPVVSKQALPTGENYIGDYLAITRDQRNGLRKTPTQTTLLHVRYDCKLTASPYSVVLAVGGTLGRGAEHRSLQLRLIVRLLVATSLLVTL